MTAEQLPDLTRLRDLVVAATGASESDAAAAVDAVVSELRADPVLAEALVLAVGGSKEYRVTFRGTNGTLSYASPQEIADKLNDGRPVPVEIISVSLRTPWRSLDDS